jgi:hypothetical protein
VDVGEQALVGEVVSTKDLDRGGGATGPACIRGMWFRVDSDDSVFSPRTTLRYVDGGIACCFSLFGAIGASGVTVTCCLACTYIHVNLVDLLICTIVVPYYCVFMLCLNAVRALECPRSIECYL